VILRPHRPENLDRLHRWKNDVEILELSADTVEPSPRDRTVKTLERWMRETDDIVHLAIHVRRTDEFIGFLHLAGIDREAGTCNLGIVIGEKDFWARGYGTDALACAAGHVFRDLGLDTILAEAYGTNPRSRALLERVGFIRTEFSEGPFTRGGEPVIEHRYELTRSAWEASRESETGE